MVAYISFFLKLKILRKLTVTVSNWYRTVILHEFVRSDSRTHFTLKDFKWFWKHVFNLSQVQRTINKRMVRQSLQWRHSNAYLENLSRTFIWLCWLIWIHQRKVWRHLRQRARQKWGKFLTNWFYFNFFSTYSYRKNIKCNFKTFLLMLFFG